MELNRAIATISTEPAIPVATQEASFGGGDVAIAAFLVMGVLFPALGFFVKWLFSQAVEGWKTKFQALEKDLLDQEKAFNLRLSELEKDLAKHDREVVTNGQFQTLEQRFENLGRSLIDTQKLFQETQKDLIQMRAQLASDYVRREDWIRFSNTLEAKMDALNRKMDERMEALLGKFIDRV